MASFSWLCCSSGGITGKGHRNVSRDFDPKSDNRKLDETREAIRERALTLAFVTEVKYSRLKSRACNNPEVQTPQGLLP